MQNIYAKAFIFIVCQTNMNGVITYGFIMIGSKCMTFSTFVHFDGGHHGITNFQVVPHDRFCQTMFFYNSRDIKELKSGEKPFPTILLNLHKFANLITGLYAAPGKLFVSDNNLPSVYYLLLNWYRFFPFIRPQAGN